MFAKSLYDELVLKLLLRASCFLSLVVEVVIATHNNCNSFVHLTKDLTFSFISLSNVTRLLGFLLSSIYTILRSLKGSKRSPNRWGGGRVKWASLRL